MNELTQTSFDYSALSVGSADRLKTLKVEISAFTDTVEASLVQIGLRFQKAQDELSQQGIKGDGFVSWIESETKYSRSSAYNLINVASRFKDKPFPNFGKSVIYALAAPSTPESVVAQAIEKAESGEKVTIAEVKEWKERAEEFRQESNDRRKKIRDLEHQVDLLKAEQPEAKVIEKVIEKEVIPPDYQQTKETLATLQAEHAKQAEALKQLRKNQKKEVDEQVNRKLKAHDREYNDKERAIQDAERYLESLQQKIDRYSSQQKDLETILSALERMRIELATFAAMLETCGPMAVPDAETKPTRAVISHMEVILTGLYARLGEHSQLLPALAVD